jgi:hypothetical protein
MAEGRCHDSGGFGVTIDAIADEVTDRLTALAEGRGRVERMDLLVARLNDRDLRAARSSLRARAGVSFSVNTTQAQRGRPTLAVRAHGVDCGFLSFNRSAERTFRMFRPSARYRHHWRHGRELEWSDARVRHFVEECVVEATRKYSSRESRIQELLFRAMRGAGRKTDGLRGFQPVLFGGVPLQLPLPVTPRGEQEPGKHQGHSDVLARSRRHGELVVFEVKRPAANRGECRAALKQAVTYAAALEHLMSREEHRGDYWRLLGSRRGPRHKPSFRVVAFLDAHGSARYESELRAERNDLLRSNRRNYDLSVMLYQRSSESIEVVRVIPGTA